MLNDVPAPEGFRGNDESRRHRQPEAFQLDHVQPLVAEIDDTGQVFAALIHRGDGLTGIIKQKQPKLIRMQGVELMKQDVQNPGQELVQLLKSQ